MAHPDHPPADRIDADTVRRVAALARLRLPPDRAEELAAELGAVLEHAGRLLEADVEGVAELAHGGDGAVRWDPDEPAAPLPADTIEQIAPDTAGPFIGIPRVLGEGGGA